MNESEGFSKRARGDRAKTLLDDPTFKGAMAEIRSNIHAQWASVPYTDTDKLNYLKVALHTLNSIELQLQNYVSERDVDILQEENGEQVKE